jgi:hypothetical protein
LWYTWIGSHLIRELLGTSGLKEGTMVAIEEKLPQSERTKEKEEEKKKN